MATAHPPPPYEHGHTLVLVPTMPLVRTLWCLLAERDLQTARDDLAKRENVLASKDRNIGFWDIVRQQGPDSRAAEYIRKTPSQIDTEYRRRMVAEIDWLKQAV